MAVSLKASVPEEDSQSQRIRVVYPRLLLAARRRLDRSGVEGEPEDVVHAAVLALLKGRCPQEVDIEAFLRKKILNIVSNAARHRKRVPKVSIEEGGLSDEYLQDVPDVETLDQVRIAGQVFDELYATAEEKGDDEVALMLLAYRDGVTTRAKVAEEVGISPRQYDAAKRRLSTFCKHLDPSLLEMVRMTYGIRP